MRQGTPFRNDAKRSANTLLAKAEVYSFHPPARNVKWLKGLRRSPFQNPPEDPCLFSSRLVMIEDAMTPTELSQPDDAQAFYRMDFSSS
jgi:hypothetical protein